jgi:Ulp1 family protease
MPLQENEYDCGVYILHYAEVFLSRPDPTLYIKVGRHDEFSPDEIRAKRMKIKNVLH